MLQYSDVSTCAYFPFRTQPGGEFSLWDRAEGLRLCPLGLYYSWQVHRPSLTFTLIFSTFWRHFVLADKHFYFFPGSVPKASRGPFCSSDKVTPVLLFIWTQLQHPKWSLWLQVVWWQPYSFARHWRSAIQDRPWILMRAFLHMASGSYNNAISQNWLK